jgi:hypothetical protein
MDLVTTYLQDNKDEAYYTRIFSIQGMILSSMPLPGLLFLGGLIELLGIQYTIIVIALFLFVLSIIALNTNFYHHSVGDGQQAACEAVKLRDCVQGKR